MSVEEDMPYFGVYWPTGSHSAALCHFIIVITGNGPALRINKSALCVFLQELKMQVLALSAACVLLLAAAQVQCQNVCYQPGVDCKPRRPPGGGGGWLQAMEESRARAQGMELSAAARAQIEDYVCDCCCGTTPCECPFNACPITQCHTRVLGKDFYYNTYM